MPLPSTIVFMTLNSQRSKHSKCCCSLYQSYTLCYIYGDSDAFQWYNLTEANTTTTTTTTENDDNVECNPTFVAKCWMYCSIAKHFSSCFEMFAFFHFVSFDAFSVLCFSHLLQTPFFFFVRLLFSYEDTRNDK